MIDPKKTYRTRDGREVRIYAVDGREKLSVHGAILTTDGWSIATWATDGIHNSNRFASDYDLIEVKPRIKREVWVNVYPEYCTPHSSKENADQVSLRFRIACVKLTIDCEEGEGL